VFPVIKPRKMSEIKSPHLNEFGSMSEQTPRLRRIITRI
jgi:hypothetical protein